MADLWWRVAFEDLRPLIKVLEAMNNAECRHRNPPNKTKVVPQSYALIVIYEVDLAHHAFSYAATKLPNLRADVRNGVIRRLTALSRDVRYAPHSDTKSDAGDGGDVPLCGRLRVGKVPSALILKIRLS